jgi:hypothetical protein
MTSIVDIDEKRLHQSLDEMSIRALLTEDNLDEFNPFDREEVTTGVLDNMHALIAPLGDINSSNWPAFSTQIEKIRSEIDGIATRGGIGRFFKGKGGNRAKDLVNGLTQLKLYARELGDRIKPGADTQIANIIHDLPEDMKAKSLNDALDSEVRRSLEAYINTLHRDHNKDKVLDKLGFGRNAATAAFLELKGEDIKSIAGLLNGIPLPPPEDRDTSDADGDGLPRALDTAPRDPNPAASVAPSGATPGTPSPGASPAAADMKVGGQYGYTTGKGEDVVVTVTDTLEGNAESVQVQRVVDGNPKGPAFATSPSKLRTLEAEEPAGAGTITAMEFGELVAANREVFADIAKAGKEGKTARRKVIRDLLKGKCFSESLAHDLETRGLSLLVEEVRITHLDHTQEVTDFRRWRHLAGMQ